MKKSYISPEIDIDIFNTKCCVTTSGMEIPDTGIDDGEKDPFEF